MSLLDQSGVTGGELDPYNVHALFVNMDNMWTERFGNYDCLVVILNGWAWAVKGNRYNIPKIVHTKIQKYTNFA